MIRMAVAKGMGTALITNGWLLPSKLEELSAAGLKTIYVSIDAASITAHERNRGLKNLVERIRAGTSRMSRRSTRVPLKIEIKVEGRGETPTCEGETIVVNLHGTLISTQRR